MIKKFLTMIFALALSACASPTFQMSPAQVASLADEQLCTYENNYRDEAKLTLEIARRGLNCDPYFRQCLARGHQAGTEAMGFCIDLLRENERLRREADFNRFDVFGYHSEGRLRKIH